MNSLLKRATKCHEQLTDTRSLLYRLSLCIQEAEPNGEIKLGIKLSK